MDGSDSSRPLVLVVDDEKLMRTLASEALEQEGYSVLAVASGNEALESFARHRPSLVMLDLHMPGRDGLSTCRELRRRPGQHRLPILVVTGTDDRSAVDAACDAGATDFVSKPVKWPLLGHRVRYPSIGAVWTPSRFGYAPSEWSARSAASTSYSRSGRPGSRGPRGDLRA